MIAIAIAVVGCLAPRSAGAAPAAATDPQGTEIVPAAPPTAKAPSVVADTAALPELAVDPLVDQVNAAGTARSWVAAHELDANALQEKFNMRIEPGGCLDLDGDAPGLGKTTGDCRVSSPGANGSTIFSLPLLAVLGWVLAILAVALGYRLYRHWRIRHWLHRLQAQGILLRPVNRRGDHPHQSSRSRARKRSASRSRAA